MITQERLKHLFHYNPETGEFIRKVANSNCVKVGDVAGSKDSNGYLRIYIDKNFYLVHRLVWLYVHGYFPENDIDHINRITCDNRLCNLRHVSRSCNLRNNGNPCTNTSGIKGVHWDKKAGKWVSSICNNKKVRYLGGFDNLLDAAKARLVAEEKLNWSGCDSNSPAYKYVKTHR
jgi:hypothetical protein